MDRGTSRGRAVEKFAEVCRDVLTEPERLGLYKLLSDYHRRRRVERLVPGLFKVIREENRMEVIHVLRQLIPYAHLPEFDRQTRQRRARGQLKTFFWDDEDDGIGTTVSFSSEDESEGEKTREDLHEVTLHRDSPSQNLGFSIRGGSEHGLGVYVSEVTPDSLAAGAGLEFGDKILSVNGVSLKNKSSSIVASLMTSSSDINMTLRMTGHLPKWRLFKEKTAWFDHEKKTVICGEFEKSGASHYIKGLDMDIPERRVTLINDGVLGLNIRGGSEFGLGIYVSSIDPGGQAERQGVRVGDQIVEVNGVKFEDVTHARAVDVLTSQDHIIITLRDVGRYPAFKEVYGKYSWIHGNPKVGTRKNKALHVKVPVEVLSQRSHDHNSDSAYNDGLPLQSEIYLPSTSQGSGKEKMIVDDSDMDDLGSVNLEMWKHAEGFQNPAYNSEFRKDEYNSGESDSDEGSGIQGEYSMMTMDAKMMEEFELVDIERKEDTPIDIEKETVIDLTLKETDDEAVYISKTSRQYSSRNNKIIEEKMEFLEPSDAEDSCSASLSCSPVSLDCSPGRLSCSPETRRYTAWSDEEIFKYNGEDESVSPASSRRSMGEYSEQEFDSRMNAPDLKEYQTSRQSSPSPASSVRYISRKDSDHIEDDIEIQEFVEKNNASQIQKEVNPYASIERQLSTGFVVSDEEIVVMRSFDRQIGDSEEIHSLPSDTEHLVQNESDSVSSSEKIKHEIKNRNLLKYESTSFRSSKPQLSPLELQEQTILLPVNQSKKDEVDNRQKEDHKDPGSSPMTEISGNLKMPKTPEKDKTRDLASKRRARGNWKVLRDKIKGSLRIKPLSRKGLEERLREIARENEQSDRQRVSSNKFQKTTVSSNSVKALEEASKRFLDAQELSDLLTQIRMYHESHDLDRLLEVLLAMLDTPEKILLLREIRSVIFPVDIYRFELSVSRYEKEAYEKLSTKLHLYLNHGKERKPKKHLLHTETDEHGHFYVKSVEQFSREQELKKTVVEALSGAKDRDDDNDGDREAYGDRDIDVLRHDSGLCSRTDSIQEDTRSDVISLKSSEISTRKITANISKNKQNLGLCVSGGIESKAQPEIKVEQVLEDGAAADEPAIQPGMVILSIDGHSMVGVRHSVAVNALRSSFSNKRKVNMTIVLKRIDT
ncbi:uncharacterized protein LOC133192790 [Saccostrea echinata]|uniref:uncharacterized protein LOC133192790 n=1 Tax=Saccostrea echinata TaxID=191078 RepID=UPI002A81E1A6|nr:uncharacterized protein LOC133192790 [Saccostrea echinata]